MVSKLQANKKNCKKRQKRQINFHYRKDLSESLRTGQYSTYCRAFPLQPAASLLLESQSSQRSPEHPDACSGEQSLQLVQEMHEHSQDGRVDIEHSLQERS